MKKGLIFLPLLMLSACTKPEVEITYNEFRNENCCRLKNNNFTGDNSEQIELAFEAMTQKDRDTLNKIDPKLTKLVKVHIQVTTGYGAGLKNDSIIHFIADGKMIQTQSLTGSSSFSTSYMHSPGYYVNGVYYPGTSYTVPLSIESNTLLMSPDEIRTLANAKSLRVKMETDKGALTAELTDENLVAMREFVAKCVDSNPVAPRAESK